MKGKNCALIGWEIYATDVMQIKFKYEHTIHIFQELAKGSTRRN